MNEAHRTLQTTPYFERAYKKYVGKERKRRNCIAETLAALVANPWNPSLGSHKLKGSLKGAVSCSCGSDCRIIFTIEPGTKPTTERIILHNIGTHDEVY